MLAEVKERLRTELHRTAQELMAGMAPELVDAAAAPAALPEAERAGLQGRLRTLRLLEAGFPVQDAALPADRAGYGSSVVLEDLATREQVSYTLVTGEVIDLDEDQVTLASPIGAALAGRRAGERVTVELPQGRRRFRIVSLTTLPQMLGMARRAPRGVSAQVG